MMSLLLSVALLVAMAAPGVAFLRRYADTFDSLEQIAYGAVLGEVGSSLVLLAFSIATAFTVKLILLTGLGCTFVALLLWPNHNPRAREARGQESRPALSGGPPVRRLGVLWQRTGANCSEIASLQNEPEPAVTGVSGPAAAEVAVSDRTAAVSRTPQIWKGILDGTETNSTARLGLAALRRLQQRGLVWPCLTLGAFILLWASFYSHALFYRDGALWATNGGHIWADWALHLGHATSFAYGNNFPPTNPNFAGDPFNYHYLSAFTAAAMLKLGMDPVAALDLQAFLLMCLVTLAVFAFARRLAADSSVATLVLVLFFLGSGVGWVFTVQRMNASHDLLGTLLNHPWDYAPWTAANFRWETVFLHAIGPQRPFLYGLPLGMLTLASLLAGIGRRDRRLFILAGIAAGLLPIAHLGTLQALALITPFLFLLFPRRDWVLFFAIWILLAVPQLYYLEGGLGRAAAGSVHLDLGWISAPDSDLWFWLKNLGLFLPLLLLALFHRDLLPPASQRFIWAFMPAFLLSNLVAFQTSDWDNTKVLTYWFLGSCVIVAALLVTTWRRNRNALVRTLIAAVVASLVLSGVLMQLRNLLGQDDYQLASAEAVSLAGQVRADTPPQALFATDLQHSDVILMLAGRHILMSYPGWLYAWGIDYSQRQNVVSAIYAYAPNAPALLSQYKIDYVVIGPDAISELGANLAAYQARYPVVIQTPSYTVFDVRGGPTR